MSVKTDAGKRAGFLTRVRRDQAGNTLAIFAAAIFPMVGLVGGAVDMARVYSVKTRLQAACDAGSLASRKVMGNGRWDINSDGNRTNDATYLAALQMFDLNYESGFIGSENRTRNFVESNGTVTGTATAEVPMVLMQVLGIEEEQVSVTCTSQMKIPHTDVMFVLDVTGSMNDPISGGTKIQGLRRAVKCFYEALARQNIDDIDASVCNKTTDPIGDLSTLTQLRFGFVPYDEQVNVGTLLQNSYFADSQPLQSRRPETEQVWTWSLGTAGGISGWNNDWSPAIPSTGLSPNLYASGTYSSYATISTGAGGITTNQGYKAYNAGNLSSSACNNLNTLQTNGGTSGSNTGITGILPETPSAPGTEAVVGTTNNPPTHPNDEQVLSYQRTRTQGVRGYRYARSGSTCYLQRSNVRNYTQTESGGTAIRPVNWTSRQRVTGWTYTQVNFDVSALKAGGGDGASLAYNSSLLMPLIEATPSVYLSGSATPTNIRVVANTPVTWSGCIEERQTVQNMDGDSSDEFSPIPDEAFDLDIDMIPDPANPATQWKFQLMNAVWGRQNGDYVATTSDLWRATLSSANGSGMPRNTSATCPVNPARKLGTYRNTAGATNFKAYVNSLTPGGNTYHDIGLLWGARLMSPTGLFGNENATTPDGQEIQRHMVFMTDGATAGDPLNYTPYGIEGWDRRRTNPSVNPTAAMLVANTDERTKALCTTIKNLGNNGVTVWVVYYGTADFNTTERMKNCATSRNNHFFPAANTSALIDAFNQIADSISELKLTG